MFKTQSTKIVYQTGDHFVVYEVTSQVPGIEGYYAVGNKTFDLNQDGFKSACEYADLLNGKVTEEIEKGRTKYKYND